MKITNKFLWVISLLIIALFTRFPAPAQAEKEVVDFYNRYKAYLKKDFKKSMYFFEFACQSRKSGCPI